MDSETGKNLAPEMIARSAATWWGAALRGEQGMGTAGDPTIDMMTAAGRQRVRVDTSRFEMRLAAELEMVMSEGRDAVLSVDYGPEGMLRRVLVATILDGERLPIKTIMWVDREGILVRVGYGAAVERLLGRPCWSVELRYRGRSFADDGYWTIYLGSSDEEARALFNAACHAGDLEMGHSEELSRRRVCHPHAVLRRDGNIISFAMSEAHTIENGARR